MKAGLNGVVHEYSDLIESLHRLGVYYLGHGQWHLPPGAQIKQVRNEDWVLTLHDGRTYQVWSEDD
jgi:hypothetical protein